MDIKYWMYQPEKMLVVHLPEEYKQDKKRITMLFIDAYTTWSNPEEDCDNEDVIEAIYDSDCAEFITDKVQKELGYQLDFSIEDCEDDNEADYILDVM